jgi:hypothetical protein
LRSRKVYFVQAESEGEAVQIALEMLESRKSVVYVCLVVEAGE